MKQWQKITLCLLAILALVSFAACGKNLQGDDAEMDTNGTAANIVGSADAAKAYEGEWYGWWQINNSSGEMADLNSIWYDCCAEVTLGKDGQAEVKMWDEVCPKKDPLAKFSIVVGEDAQAMVSSGWFYDEENGAIQDLDFSINNAVAENLIIFEGHYESESSSFDFLAYLRPWGQLWDDMDPAMLPGGYEGWYLPLLDAGESAPNEIFFE